MPGAAVRGTTGHLDAEGEGTGVGGDEPPARRLGDDRHVTGDAGPDRRERPLPAVLLGRHERHHLLDRHARVAHLPAELVDLVDGVGVDQRPQLDTVVEPPAEQLDREADLVPEREHLDDAPDGRREELHRDEVTAEHHEQRDIF